MVPSMLFSRFATNQQTVKAETGYEQDVLETVYQNNFVGLSPVHVYNVYKHIHMYPHTRQLQTVMGISQANLSRHIYPMLEAMAQRINEIDYNDRLSPYNHVVHFPTRVTALVDTYVVHVSIPNNTKLARVLYNPKYSGCVLKWQVAVDFCGNYVLLTGPHVAYDGHIFSNTIANHPMYPWELWLGDGHYIGLPNVASPFRNDHVLSQEELRYNIIHSFYRSRVEQAIRRIKVHSMFQVTYRGSWEVLSWAMKVIVHTTNVENQLRPKYALVGPWPHI